MDPRELWYFLPIGYLFSIAVETPVLLVGLSARHSIGRRLFAGVWLTACTYPIVVLVLYPLLMPEGRRPVPTTDLVLYLLIAETFAPVAECALFWAAFGDKEELGKRSFWRDMITIVLANLASFGLGEVVHYYGWF
jgi:hypothetical protein